jgi:hypothetical protein
MDGEMLWRSTEYTEEQFLVQQDDLPPEISIVIHGPVC